MVSSCSRHSKEVKTDSNSKDVAIEQPKTKNRSDNVQVEEEVLLVSLNCISCKKNIQKKPNQEITQQETTQNVSTNDSIVYRKTFKDAQGIKKLIVKEVDSFEKSEMFLSISLNDTIQTKVYDLINECPVDHYVTFNEESLSITDLDSDGIKEISFVYRLACKGDISNSDMKLILIEGSSKYKLRGSTFMQFDSIQDLENYNKGSFNIDESFVKAPDLFLQHSLELWNKFLWEGGNINYEDLNVIKTFNINKVTDFIKNKK